MPTTTGILSPRRHRQTPYIVPFLTLLLLTATLGTLLSLRTSSTLTSFRSRLPASSLSTTSLLPKSIPYFADKRNVLNQVFVKQAWAWTTAVWATFVLASFLPGATAPRRTQAVLTAHVRRYVLATLYWWYLTQSTWFFGVGPSLSHRVLLYSGAECVPSALSSDGGGMSAFVEGGKCDGRKGDYWRGGHDVSGHTFLLVHASLFLWETIAPSLPTLFPSFFPHSPRATPRPTRQPNPILQLATLPALALILLWWWMLLMTSLFFHTPAEKVSGMMFALAGWWVMSGRVGRVVSSRSVRQVSSAEFEGAWGGVEKGRVVRAGPPTLIFKTSS